MTWLAILKAWTFFAMICYSIRSSIGCWRVASLPTANDRSLLERNSSVHRARKETHPYSEIANFALKCVQESSSHGGWYAPSTLQLNLAFSCTACFLAAAVRCWHATRLHKSVQISSLEFLRIIMRLMCRFAPFASAGVPTDGHRPTNSGCWCRCQYVRPVEGRPAPAALRDQVKRWQHYVLSMIIRHPAEAVPSFSDPFDRYGLFPSKTGFHLDAEYVDFFVGLFRSIACPPPQPSAEDLLPPVRHECCVIRLEQANT